MPGPSTQSYIDIAAIKDGVVILKDGTYRMIISVSAANFALKSEEEQNAVVFQFQNFLNSLKFPIEIVIQSRKVDLNLYLEKVLALSKKQENELIKQQTIEYVDFVKKLINVANIMKKRFFVVISYQTVSVTGSGGLLGGLFKKKSNSQIIQISDDTFKKNVEYLEGNCRSVLNGLSSMNLACKKLETAEIINLFYQLYNPDIANQERLDDLDSLVKTHVEENPPATSTADVQAVTPMHETVETPTADATPIIDTTANIAGRLAAPAPKRIPIVHLSSDGQPVQNVPPGNPQPVPSGAMPASSNGVQAQPTPKKDEWLPPTP